MNRFHCITRPIACVLLLGCAGISLAAQPAAAPAPDQANEAATLPDWEQLTPEQRETVIGSIRDRWNGNPDNRTRLFKQAQRWRQLTPEQRSNALRGARKWQGMNPQQREQARAAFQRMQAMPPEQRKALRQQLKGMTPEQRRAWLQQNGPGKP